MRLDDLLADSAASNPDAPAVIEPERSITYRALDRQASTVGAALRGAGVRPGDRVVLALENSTAFVACYFGILRAGAAAVPLPPGPRSDRLLRAVEDCAPAAAIVDQDTWPLLQQAPPPACFILPRKRSAEDDADALLDAAFVESPTAGRRDPGEHGPRDLAAIIYTSGSTGAPRGVMLTHGNFTANAASIVDYLELSSADRVMVVLPFYYVYGLSLLHTHVAVGGSLVLNNRFAFPNVVLAAMQEHRVTGFAGVPSTFAMLLHKSNVRRTALPSLRYVTQAGGPMPPARVREWLDAVPGVPFFIMYGATEAAARLAYLPPSELARRRGSIGRAIPGVTLRILREDGAQAAAGEIGEIVARGANISPGYWNSPEETSERFGPQGFRTGDLGFADEDGFLYLVGRRHDMIKVGAHRVSAREIEDALCEHPAVHEAAVVAEPHNLLGEVPIAYVTIREGGAASEPDLLTFCRASLPEPKVPARIVFLPELPKGGTGKIDKSALRQGAVPGRVA
jgi:amino acid adenylation domain-containing protein